MRFNFFRTRLLLGFLMASLYSLSAISPDASLRLLTQTENGLRFRAVVNQLHFAETIVGEGSYTLLQLENLSSDYARSGLPNLPVFTRLIAIPEGAVIRIDIEEKATRILSVHSEGFPAPLMPLQPSLFKDQDPEEVAFVKNQQAYQTDAFGPDKNIRVEYLGKMRGVQMARLVYAPFRYNPVQHLLEVTEDITVEIAFEDADMEATRAQLETYYSPAFRPVYARLLNPLPESINESSGLPMKLVIVSDPMFQTALQDFIAWKKKKGFTVIEAYTNNPGVGSTTASIKSYLQGLYNAATPSDPAPSYAILVGDVAQIPAFAGTTGTHPSDLYYFEYDGAGDYLPELFYGRFSANNLTELQPQLDKTLEYEMFLMPDTSFLADAVMVAGMDNSFGPTHGNGQINYGNSLYFNSSNGITSHTWLYPASGNSASQIISQVSSGAGFVNYTAHCGSNGWSDPSFTTSNVNSLQNTSKYPLMIGNCCLSNKFDVTCFGEALVRAQGKGALAYIGGSNNTLWDEDFYWSVGTGSPGANPTYAATGLGAYDRLFHTQGEARSEWFETNGQIVAAGNMAVSASTSSQDKYYWEIYHLMGDPTVMTYLGRPSDLYIAHNPVMPVGMGNLAIQTEPYTYVGISRNGVLQGAGLADSLGNLNLLFAPFLSPGPAMLVASKQNRIPYIDSVMVIVPNGPYVGIQQVAITDLSGGNNNGLADYGESIQLDLRLENFGNLPASQLTATLWSNDTLLNITDSTVIFSSIGAGDTLLLPSAFSLDIAAFVPDQHLAALSILITDTAGNLWSYPYTLKLNAPLLQILEMGIDDQVLGNGNGSIDPGESIEVVLRLKNNGHSAAGNPSLYLTTYSPLATLVNGSASLNTMAGGDEQWLQFQMDISSAAQAGDVIEVHSYFVAGLYDATAAFAPTVGSMVEDFESGDFTLFPWVMGGNQPWIVSGSGAWEGSYCSASGSIGNSSASVMEIEMNVLMYDSISFYRKVSSEDGYDYLTFSIDGLPLDQWSGNESWTKVAYPVAPGQRTFRWAYEKDFWVSSGSDKAWIDYVEFPAVAGIVTGQENAEAEMLLQAWPNPSKGAVNVRLYLPSEESCSLVLTDEAGRLVQLISEQKLRAGYHQFQLSDRLAAGMYHLVMQGEKDRRSLRLVVLP